MIFVNTMEGLGGNRNSTRSMCSVTHSFSDIIIVGEMKKKIFVKNYLNGSMIGMIPNLDKGIIDIKMI